MPRANKRFPYKSLTVSLIVSILLSAGGVLYIESLAVHRLLRSLGWPLLRLVFFITLGLVVGQTIENTGWTRRLAVLSAPLFRFSHLGRRCAAAFTTSFFSGVAANAMLLVFFEEDKISRRKMFLGNLMNQVPAYFLHLPTTLFIVIPLTGWAGALYFIMTFLALVLRTLCVVLYGRLRCPSEEMDSEGGEGRTPHNHGPEEPLGIVTAIYRHLPGRLARIVVYVVPIYTLVFLVTAAGGFDAIRQWMARFVVTSVLPVESLSVVILSFAAEFTSGFAAAGALMDAGVLSIKQTLIALLAGNIVAFPIRALRHQLPRYMGIFSPVTGLQMLLLGQTLRVCSLVMVGIFFYYLT